MSNTFWSETEFLRPAFIGDETWKKILSNFLDRVGDPVDNLSTALAGDRDKLEALGVSSPNAFDALHFELEQAGDFGSLVERDSVGSLGQGWSSLADIKLLISDQGVKVSGLLNGGVLGGLDASNTAQYAVSLSLNKIVGQDGYFSGSEWTRPVFTSGQKASDGLTLETMSGGYQITAGTGEKYLFDETGKLESFITAVGKEITVTYDGNDRISRYDNDSGGYLEFTYDGAGHVESVEDGKGRTVNFDFNGSGQLTDVTDNAGASEFTYDGDGNLLTAQRIGGSLTTLSYDAAGRLASQDIGGISETYAYGSAGAITMTNEISEQTVIQIAPGGRVIGGEDNLGHSYSVTADPVAHTVTITDQNNVNSILTYDASGHLMSAMDGNGDTVSFTYDALTKDMISFTDGEGSGRAFDYDGAGHLLTATWTDNTFLGFDYDVDGHMVEFTNRRGESVEYDYDAKGLVTDVSDSASGALSYSYNAHGNATSITSSAGTTEITYDSADRVTLIEYPNGRSLAYTYDDEGKRLSMVNQDHEGTYYSYDAAGHLASVSDNNGVLTSYGYDAAGRLILETNANGSHTEYDYNSAGRIDEITNYDSGNAITSFYQYTFDPAGRATEIVTNDGTWIYDYDNAGQLIGADFTSTTLGVSDKSIVYEYDGAGNRIATVEDSITTNYTINDQNEYTVAGGKSFTYDNDGNLVTQTETGNNYSYIYDIDNRLIQVTKPDSTVITYEYDALGNRAAMVDNGVRTEYLVDPFGMGNVVAEYDSLGARTASYVYGLGLASKTDSIGNHAFYDVDATGNIIGLTDNSGVLANSYIYTPFGGELYESETILNSFEFNGAFGVSEDAENLFYMRARSYDAELGRFLSEDPLFLSGDISNLYRFANNDPIQLVDPLGESKLGAMGLAYNAGIIGHIGYEMLRTNDPVYREALMREVAPAASFSLGGAAIGARFGGGIAFDAISSALLLRDLYDKYIGKASAAEGNNHSGNGNGGGGNDGGHGGGGGGGPGGGPEGLPPPHNGAQGGTSGAEGRGSPLVLDLGATGITLSALNGSGSVYWDIDNDHFREATGWVSATDGLLSIDLNANGIIDNNGELFGNQGDITNGFVALAQYDSNKDGHITSADSQYADLRVWIDADTDGFSDSAELNTLSSLGITDINLAYTDVNTNNNGNTIKQTGTFTLNGTTHTIVDAWFAYDNVNTVYDGDWTPDVRTLFLPNLRGYGLLPQLNIAMSMDNTGIDNLLSQVNALRSINFVDLFTAETDARITQILYRWASVDPNMATDARGPYLIDAKHLEFIEQFVGHEFVQRTWNENPHFDASNDLETVWSNEFNALKAELLIQVAGTQLFTDASYYDTLTGMIVGTQDLSQSALNDLASAALLLDSADRSAFWTDVANFIISAKGAVTDTTELSWLNTAISNSSVPGGIDTWTEVVDLLGPQISLRIYDTNSGNVINGGSGHDQLYGFGGNDTISGNDGNDLVSGDDGNDTLYGNAGHDHLTGGNGNDILDGGIGGDTLEGGSGDDTYIFTSGDDAIIESSGTADVINLPSGITISDLTLFRTAANDLIIQVGLLGTITIQEHFSPDSTFHRVETLVFADTSTMSLVGLTNTITYGSNSDDSLLGVAFGGNLNNIIYAYGGNDVIQTGSGNDTIYGGEGSDRISAGDGANTVYGEAGNDLVYMGAGVDTVHGGDGDDVITYLSSGAGNDVLYGDGGNDKIDGGSDNDTIDGGDGNDTLSGGTGLDTITGGSGNDYISGGNDADVLYGGDGADTIDGGTGADEIHGGDGNDIIYPGGGADTLIYGDGGDDLIDMQSSLGNNTLHGGDGNDTILDLNDGNDTLYGDDGDDILKSGPGNDTVYGGNGNDYIDGGYGSVDTLYGEAGNDTIIAGYGNDVISGGDGDDIITAGTGNDSVQGGDGNDTYYYLNASGTDTYTDSSGSNDKIIISTGPTPEATAFSIASTYNLVATFGSFSSDIITIVDQLNTSTTKQIETMQYADGFTLDLTKYSSWVFGTSSAQTTNGDVGSIQADDTIFGRQGNDTINGLLGNDTLSGDAGDDIVHGNDGNDQVHGGSGNDTLYGDAGNDKIWGADGNDVLFGGSGNDILDGGAGTDTVNYSLAAAGITSSLASGTTSNDGNGGSDTLTAIENITGSAYADTLAGDGEANVLSGGAGNDTIDGGSGDDTINGGAGDDYLTAGFGSDTLSYSDATSAITINLSLTSAQATGGSGSDTISGFENVIGSAYNDTLTGDGNANIIQGGSGNDTMDGAGGNDTLSYSSATSVVTINLSLTSTQTTGGAGNDTISNFENLIGSIYADSLTGNALSNNISGGDGNDTINAGDGDDIVTGGYGSDILNGGNGNDTVSYAQETAAATVNLATGSGNISFQGTDTLSGFENIIGSNSSDTLTGDGNDNIIQGLQGSDVINGAGGIDTVSYVDATAGVTVNLASTTTQNTIGAGVDTITNMENIWGSAFNDTLTGNGSDNVIQGGAGNDVLNGAGGTDTVSYVDSLSGVTVDLSLVTAQNTGGSGTDTLSNFENLTGSAFADTLNGSSANNVIIGGSGNDNIYGAGGADTLYGGSGADIFILKALTAFSPGLSTITDFNTSDGDKIDIHDVLSGSYDPLTDAIGDFVQITESGGNSALFIDRDGLGSTYGYDQVASITGVTGITNVDDLITNGNLAVV